MTDPTPAFSQPDASPYTTPAVVVRRTNGFAIASLIASLLGLGIIGVILGHVALGQIRRSGDGGRALAIGGLVIGYLAIVVTLALLGLWIYTLSTGDLVFTPLIPADR